MSTKSTNPLVSVVIPMYNAEKFIAKCLTHLVHQTYKNLEILIINDGSTDNSEALCKEWAKSDKRIKIITQKNAGPSLASNYGLEIASGEWVHFHDHDDFVNLDYFEKMMNVAALTDVDILCGEVNQPDYSFPVFNSTEICTTLDDKVLVTCANVFKPAWRYVYKKDFLMKHNLRFESAIFGAQDLVFTRSALVLAESVATVPGAKYNVVNTATALGKQRKKLKEARQTPECANAWKRYAEFLVAHGATEIFNTPKQPFKTESLKIFNRTIFRKDILTKRVRYYLFGIHIATKHIAP